MTDTLPAIALVVEPTEKIIMQHKPRGRNSNFFSGGVFSSIIYQGLLEGGITLLVYWLALTYPVHATASLAHATAKKLQSRWYGWEWVCRCARVEGC
ncbi:hypothetical protein WP50_04315 [Lactiplantibacillus plantarum]|nr:hypothetical protein WP50_04315 [Lactiplantibacillus plantarum]